MGTRQGWIKTCPATLRMIANQDLKATLLLEDRILNPISVRYRDANIVWEDSNQPAERQV